MGQGRMTCKAEGGAYRTVTRQLLDSAKANIASKHPESQHPLHESSLCYHLHFHFRKWFTSTASTSGVGQQPTAVHRQKNTQRQLSADAMVKEADSSAASNDTSAFRKGTSVYGKMKVSTLGNLTDGRSAGFVVGI